MTPSIDANILIRALIRDIPVQSDKVIQFTNKHKSITISDTAIIETIFALNKYYKIPRPEVCVILNKLIINPQFICSRKVFANALNLYKNHTSLSIEDCYMSALAEHSNQTPLYTFDKKLANQINLVELL